MKKAFLGNAVFLMLINVLVKPLYIFGVDRTVQNLAGAEAYGLYFAFFGMGMILNIVNDFGIQNFNNRLAAQYPQSLPRYFPNLLLLKLLLGLIYLCSMALMAWLWGYPANTFLLLGLVALGQWLDSLMLYLRSNISGLGYYTLDSLLSVANRLLVIIVFAGLWWAGLLSELTITKFAALLVLAQLVSVLLIGKVVLKYLPWPGWKTDWPQLLVILRQSYPYAMILFLMAAYSRIDALMLERIADRGAYEAGVYAAGYRLLDAVNMIGFLVAGLLLPMFAKLLKEKAPVLPLVQEALLLLWSIAIPVTLGTMFYRVELASWLYKQATPYWGDVLGLLMLTFITSSGVYIFGTLLTANGKLGSMNRLFALTLLINILLNLALIPPLKAVGAALATLITQVFSLSSQYWLAKRTMNIHLDRPVVLKILMYVAGSALVFYGLHALLPVHYWLIGLFGGGGACLVMAFAFKVLNLREIIQLARSRQQE